MSYDYDIFLSYNRKFPHGKWVNETFYPLFEAYMSEAVGDDVKIFKDSAEIKSGNAWKQRIRGGLIKSKVMVSILSPSYFRSEWCLREFSAIHFRQTQLGFLSLENPNGLIIPLKIFDGEHFPEYANDLQIFDCIMFNRVGEGVRNTNMYIEFQGKLQEWVYDVAKAIKHAPEWSDTFNSKEWIDDPYDQLILPKEPIIKQPLL